jgi:malate dehydrogenase
VAGIPLNELLPEDKINAIIERARKGGGEIVGLIGVSAWYAPAAAAYEMVESILKDQRRVIASAVLLKGEYGYEGLYIGVPAVLGKNGVEKVIEFELTESERAMLDKSAESVRSVVNVLGY